MRSKYIRAAVLGTVLMLVGSAAAPVFAMGDWPRDFKGRHHAAGKPGKVTNVPEMDAGAGFAALAAVGAMLAFAWERRRG